MSDLYGRISHLETIVAAILGIQPAAVVQDIRVAGAGIITAAGSLVLIQAPGAVQLTLAQPTVQQNGIAVVVLTANTPGAAGSTPANWNSITTAANGISDNGVTPKFFHVLSDNGVPGAVVKLTAQNGLWILSGGNGWSAA